MSPHPCRKRSDWTKAPAFTAGEKVELDKTMDVDEVMEGGSSSSSEEGGDEEDEEEEDSEEETFEDALEHLTIADEKPQAIAAAA